MKCLDVVFFYLFCCDCEVFSWAYGFLFLIYFTKFSAITFRYFFLSHSLSLAPLTCMLHLFTVSHFSYIFSNFFYLLCFLNLSPHISSDLSLNLPVSLAMYNLLLTCWAFQLSFYIWKLQSVYEILLYTF